MKRIIFLLFSMSVFLIGCYEDKGCYDYKDIQNFQIKFPTNSVRNKTVGDTIRINPEFDIDVPDDASYLTYVWTVAGETRPDDPHWNSRNFFWIADKMMSEEYIVLEVTDTRYGVTYMQEAFCTITGEFDAWMSWTILSKDTDGRTMLSFFRSMNQDFADDGTIYLPEVKIYKDLYPFRNGGENLGNGPLGMLEHFSRDDNTVGQYWIFTEEGAVDLDGEGFEKDIELGQTFMGGMPTDVKIQGGVCMIWVDVMYDQHGRLYSRVKADAGLFNSDYFLPDPVKYEGEVLEQCEPILGRYMNEVSHYTPIIDRKNSRMLAIMDGDNGEWNEDPLRDAAEIIGFPSSVSDGIPDNYIPLDDFRGYEVLSMQYILFGQGWRQKPGFVVLFKDGAGNLWLEEFMLTHERDVIHGNYLEISQVKVYSVQGLGTIPSLMATPSSPISRYSFFAIGNQVWMYNRDDGSLGVYQEFDAKVTAMECESYGNWFLTVGLENGEFYVLSIVNAKNRPEDQRIIAQLPREMRLGEIIQINYKLGSWN